jgi:hypothetical protein
MLGRLLQLAGPDAHVIVLSDHGFSPDQHRRSTIPAELAGPAVEHRHFGIVCMNGPRIRSGETVYGASVLDITPTLLHLFDLPIGADMDGKVLTAAFEGQQRIATIPSWEDVPGDAGLHPPDAQHDPLGRRRCVQTIGEPRVCCATGRRPAADAGRERLRDPLQSGAGVSGRAPAGSR